MKRHTMSWSQGTIVVLTVLIGITLGMTNPSTVLAGKAQYVVTVELICINTEGAQHTTAEADYYFYSSKNVVIGNARVVCDVDGPNSSNTVTGTTEPMSTKPAYWVGELTLTDPLTPKTESFYGYTRSAQYFPTFGGTTDNLTCVSPVDSELHEVLLTIFDPTFY